MKYFGIIYKVTNKINDKVYIGQTTKQLKERKLKHINDAKSNRYNSIFHKALIKYGFDSFWWEILEYCEDYEELNEMEFHYMMQYNSVNSGYNMYFNTYCQSGKLNPNYGNTMSENMKNKISKMALDRYSDGKNHPWIGRKHTKETKEKMKKARKERAPISEETRLKMSKAQIGRKHTEATKLKCSSSKKGENNPFYDKTLSKEHKRKLSNSLVGKKNPFYGKKHSEEAKAKMREAWKKRKLEQLEAI